jgi:hypothetical protein
LTIVAALLAVCVGCGAQATSVPESAVSAFTSRFGDAVWYAEVGESTAVAVLAPGIVAEDGVFYPDAISVIDPGNGSTYVNGVFAVEVPDVDTVYFTAQVGFAAASVPEVPVRFSVVLQNGDHFPTLGEVVSDADGRLDHLVADLAPYRGENIVLILSASVSGSDLPGDLLWVAPSISNALR